MGKDKKGDREDEKMQGIISMAGLIAYVVASIEKMKDPRQPRACHQLGVLTLVANNAQSIK